MTDTLAQRLESHASTDLFRLDGANVRRDCAKAAQLLRLLMAERHAALAYMVFKRDRPYLSITKQRLWDDYHHKNAAVEAALKEAKK